MSTSDKSSGKDSRDPKVERRKGGDRRVSTTDRRNADRVVPEPNPRRRNPDRRKR